jgi:hypothetical protein
MPAALQRQLTENLVEKVMNATHARRSHETESKRVWIHWVVMNES